MGGRIAAVAWLGFVVSASTVYAQPKPDTGGDEGGEIEMGDESATPPDAPTPPPVVKDPKLAKKWTQAGHQLVAKGDAAVKKQDAEGAKAQYENAVTAYEKALEAGADVGVRILLGDLHDKLGKYVEAVKDYRLVAAADSGAKAADLKKAKAKLDAELDKVGLINVSSTPAGAILTLNGAEIGPVPLPESLVVMPGTYTANLTADGYQPKEVEIVVEAGGEVEKAVDLDQITVTIAPPHAPSSEEPVAVAVHHGPSKAPLIVGGVLTGAFVATAVVTGVLALGQHTKFEDATATPQQHADAKVRGERLSKITDAAFGGAIVAGGFTAIWYLVKYRHGGEAATEPSIRNPSAPVMSKIDMVPWVQSDASGLSLFGAF